ncbi:MAG TPA: hypothetical protein VF066_18520 [Thermoleophilaceae bacterium]
MSAVCPYIEPPTIPEGMSVREYRINRPRRRASRVRRLLTSAQR